MEILETRAIVLNGIDWSESSKIVGFYTRDLGLTKLIVRSAKKSNSPFQGLLDPGQILNVQVDYKPTRQLNYLRNADLINDNQKIIQHLNSYYMVLASIELLNQTMQENDAHSEIFDELEHFRTTVESRNDSEMMFIHFIVKYINLMGYEFDLTSCSNCGNQNLTQIQFDIQTGLRCQNCLLHHIENDFSPKMFQLLNYSYLHTYLELNQKMTDRTLFKSTLHFMLNYLGYHVGHKIKIQSLDFIT